MARATDRIHVELAKQRAVRVLVQPIEPVESLDGLGCVARRFLEGNHHKTVRCKTANHALVGTRSRTTTRAPHHNGVLLVRIVGQALGVREDSFPIPAGIRLVLDFHIVLFFFLVVREENFRHGGLHFFARRGFDLRFAGRRCNNRFARSGCDRFGTSRNDIRAGDRIYICTRGRKRIRSRAASIRQTRGHARVSPRINFATTNNIGRAAGCESRIEDEVSTLLGGVGHTRGAEEARVIAVLLLGSGNGRFIAVDNGKGGTYNHEALRQIPEESRFHLITPCFCTP